MASTGRPPGEGGESATGTLVLCNLCETPIADAQPPRWVRDGFEIFKCSSCGLVFRGDLPSPEDLLSIYNHGYFLDQDGANADSYADYLSDDSEHRLIARRRLARLDRASASGRLLDVGCAAGFFIDEARARGWEARGIDVSPEMSAWGREQLGLEIATGVFQTADYPSGSVDAVTMWDYIEHSIDPAADFAKAADVLRPGGVLMLSTGDVASLVARVSGRRWHLLTPNHHNFFFSVATLGRYLHESGFEVLSAGHPGARYSLRYVTHKLGTMAPRSRGLRRLSAFVGDRRRLGDRSIPLNLFDIATIAARRT